MIIPAPETPVEAGMIPYKKRTVMIVVEAVMIVPIPCRVGVQGRVGIRDGRIAFFVSDCGRGSNNDPGGRYPETHAGTDDDLGITGGSDQASGDDHSSN